MPEQPEIENALSVIRAAIEAEAKAKVIHEEAAVALAQALRQANALGISWSRLSERLGLSVAQIRWRSYVDNAPESVANRRASDSKPANVRTRVETPGTIGVTEAARRLNKSRQWVYKLAESGKLHAERDSAGYWRIDEKSIADLAE